MIDNTDNDEVDFDLLADRIGSRNLNEEEWDFLQEFVRRKGRPARNTLKAHGRAIAIYVAMKSAFGIREKEIIADAVKLFGGAPSTIRQYAKDFRDETVEPLGSVVGAMEALRPFFTEADIRTAVQAYVNAGGRELAGVRIYRRAELV